MALGGIASGAASRALALERPRRTASPSSEPDQIAQPASYVAQHYGPVSGEPFPVPAVNLRQINPAFLIKTVTYDGSEEPGTIVINPETRYLYLVQDGGAAIRYGVGVGRQGFAWSGTATIKSKQEWPDWYPPAEMIARQPELRREMSALQSGLGMAGGPRNPLGARAMYLWQGNKDTLYRIHGTIEPWSIGKRASSGCIRMINQDAIDLYARVPLDTKVVVLGSGAGEVALGRRRRGAGRHEPVDGSLDAPDAYGAYDPYRGAYGSRPYGPQGTYPYGRRRITNPYELQGDIYGRPYLQGRGYDPYGGYYRSFPDN